MKKTIISVFFLSLFFNLNIYSQDKWDTDYINGDRVAYVNSSLFSEHPVYILFRRGTRTRQPTLSIAVNRFVIGSLTSWIQFDNRNETTLKAPLRTDREGQGMSKITGSGYKFYKIGGDIERAISDLKKYKSLNIKIRDYYDNRSRLIADKNISLRGSTSSINYVLGIKPKPDAKPPVNINSNPNLNNNRYDLVDDATRRYNNIANEKKSSDKIEKNSSNLSARSDITDFHTAVVVILIGLLFVFFGVAAGRKKEKDIKSKSKDTKKPNNKTSKEITKNQPVESKKNQNKKPKIDIEKINWNGNGSGLLISKDGYIATNNHVVTSEKYTVKNLGVEFNYKDEIKTFKAKVIKSDKINDLAIIKITDKNFKGLKSIPYSAIEDEADLGEEVFALGYPMALTLMGNDIKFTDGRISSKTGYKGDISTYQTTTPIQAGSSGGPLFDFKGNLLGINSSGLDKKIADNVAYTIKTSYLKTLLNVLPKKIQLPKENNFEGLSNTEKIKILTKYVVLIKIELV